MTATKSYMPNLELCASATWILLASATHAHINQLFTFVEIKGVAAKTAGGLGVCMYVLSLFLVFGMAYDDLRHALRSIPKKAMYAYICYIIIFIFFNWSKKCKYDYCSCSLFNKNGGILIYFVLIPNVLKFFIKVLKITNHIL